MALAPDPAPTDPKGQAAWKGVTGTLAKTERFQRVFANRRASAARERANPPPMIRKVNFCNASAEITPRTTMDQ
jgi:hypothetical protein